MGALDNIEWLDELEALDDFDSVEVQQPKRKGNMSETVQGIVEKINLNKSGFYGVLMGDTWYGAGKYEPKFNEGDEVSFGVSMNGKYANMDYKTVTIVNKGTGSSSQQVSSTGGTVAKGTTNWDLKDKRITYLASRKDALQMVDMLLSHESFTLPAKKADRMEVVVELVNNLTKEYYEEIYNTPFSTGE